MTDSLAGVVLAAGAGERLRPLTRHRPKVLCPVNNVALVDLALARFEGLTSSLAVNVHHGREQLMDHLGRHHPQVHVSIEEPEALGTAGAVGQLRDWIAGRPALVVNGDTWCSGPGSLAPLLDGWDGKRIRVLVAGDTDLTARSTIAASLHPWAVVRQLEAVPTGLYEVSWRAAAEAGQLEVVAYEGPCVDCATPARYLAANLQASGGESVIGPGAVVRGTVERSVIWAGAVVASAEHLVDAIRTDDGITVFVR